LFQGRKIATYQGLLLGPAPRLELAFVFDRVGDAIEPLREDQRDGPAISRVAAKNPIIVLGNARPSAVRVVLM